MNSKPVFYKPEEDIFVCSPEAVLAAIDEFGQTQNFLMNVGEEKGKIVTDIIMNRKPETIVEIGGYIGYSAIMFGNALRRAGGQRYISLELTPKFATTERALIAFAGLDDTVEIREGPCRESLRQLAETTKDIGMLFLDHSKPSYLNDLKLGEELGLVAPGTIVIADDMYQPGNPPYSEYMRASTASKEEACKPFRNCFKDDHISLGNPALVYGTAIHEGLQPTGLPVSYYFCFGGSN
ncbi:O-methyltransferase [Aspergillus homomorphus CBS 101889]|uniref:catechol O-methyltransferase n=1 Tax=Aspergillus homomorphus (strain CBS 101889) TaxID=1450537 RepID=A0A395IEU3_ASPHC|nr:S-adenosyl-L-methionine-dependent methyltransferase [Aspergillus homomorphus CBS 101889]RAL17703.1 S-adenosyl-L-methionine-dependent methyltransferase [Aspergillus homomorphus CBS 101889]